MTLLGVRLGSPASVATAIALVLCAPARADRPAAEFFGQRGEQACRDKKWEEAIAHYRRALQEDETYLPARWGLGEALVSGGQRAPGIEEMRRFVGAAESLSPLPGDWSPVLSRARKRLAEIDALGTELEKITDASIGPLLVVAKRWKKKDPDVSKRALVHVLALRPGHAEATKLLEEIGFTAPTNAVPLFNGRDEDGWVWMGPPTFSIVKGVLVGDTEGKAIITRTARDQRGDFDLALEARVEKTFSEPFYFALGLMKAEYDVLEFGVFEDNVQLRERKTEKHTDKLFAKDFVDFEKPIDPRQWNRFEMRFREGRVILLVNGAEVHSRDRPQNRDGGFVSLKIQECVLHVRSVTVAR